MTQWQKRCFHSSLGGIQRGVIIQYNSLSLLDKNQTMQLGLQYHRNWMGKGFQLPPSYSYTSITLAFPLSDSCSQTNRLTDQRMNQWTDKASCRVANPRLKTYRQVWEQNGMDQVIKNKMIMIQRTDKRKDWSTDRSSLLTRSDTRQSSRGWLGRSSNAKTARNSTSPTGQQCVRTVSVCFKKNRIHETRESNNGWLGRSSNAKTQVNLEVYVV